MARRGAALRYTGDANANCRYADTVVGVGLQSGDVDAHDGASGGGDPLNVKTSVEFGAGVIGPDLDVLATVSAATLASLNTVAAEQTKDVSRLYHAGGRTSVDPNGGYRDEEESHVEHAHFAMSDLATPAAQEFEFRS